jgi:thioesterase domain-containing protein
MATIGAPRLTELEHVLHAEIPLTRAMGVTVKDFDASGLTLAAPLAPNINHKSTAFGGSLATLATLAGWGLLQLLLRDRQPVTVVIQESRAQYLLPVTGDFTATAFTPAAEALEKFRTQLDRRGVARIDLVSSIPVKSRVAVHFEGRFVAFKKQGEADSGKA